MSEFPAATPHGAIEEIGADLFRVRGTVTMGPGVTIPRNMAILRRGGELTVISSVRLDAAGEAALEKLGKVAHVLKIGTHGMDDPYYVSRFGATLWALPGAYKGTPPAHEALAEGALSMTEGQLFAFHDTVDPEGAILLEGEGGTLLTCDSVQHWTSLEGCSFLAKPITWAMGFLKPVNIGPPWRSRMTKKGGSLKADFERLAALPFENVLGGHGDYKEGGANAGLRATIQRVYG